MSRTQTTEGRGSTRQNSPIPWVLCRSNSLCDKFEYGSGPKLSAGFQQGRWKAGLIGRIRKVLRFQTEALGLLVRRITFAVDTAVEKVAAIQLQSGLGRPHFQDTSTFRI